MKYIIENENLKVTVNSFGAEVSSVISKASGDECIWQADPDVWARHAPILFPYTGKLTGGEFTHKGVSYKGAQHGFARDVEHKMISQDNDSLTFELTSNDEIKKLFPFEFVLKSVFSLDGNTLIHELIVENPTDEELSFGLGFHPAFNCPFDASHDTTDYEFKFDRLENPIVVETMPNGLLTGRYSYFGSNIKDIPLTDRLFDNDSICMINLSSTTLGVYEKDSDKSIVCDIENFPYTLIWSKATEKLKFVCIEPWNSLPGCETDSKEWTDKPAAAVLKKDESFKSVLKTTFNR